MTHKKRVTLTPAFETPAGIITMTFLFCMLAGGLYLAFSHSFRFGYTGVPLAGWSWSLPLIALAMLYKIRLEPDGNGFVVISMRIAGFAFKSKEVKQSDVSWLPFLGKNKFYVLHVNDKPYVVVRKKTVLKTVLALSDEK